jgi:hypothetical protein
VVVPFALPFVPQPATNVMHSAMQMSEKQAMPGRPFWTALGDMFPSSVRHRLV